MKTFIVCVILIAAQLRGLAAFNSTPDNNGELPKESSWVKSETGLWYGDKVCYKIDKSTLEARLSNAIKLSHNKRKWISSTDVVWQDKQGRLLHIYNNRLLCTTDNKHWLEVPDKTWQGLDGNWYKFDSAWDLWEVKQ